MIHVIPKVPEFVQFIVQFRDQRGFDAVHDRLIVVYEASRRQFPLSPRLSRRVTSDPRRFAAISKRLLNASTTTSSISPPTPFHGPRSTRETRVSSQSTNKFPSFLSFFLASCHIRNFPLDSAELDNGGMDSNGYYISRRFWYSKRDPRAMKARQLLLPSSRWLGYWLRKRSDDEYV